MKKEIWKFPLSLMTSQVVSMPVGAEIMALQVQNNTPCMWALVDPEAEKEYRTFIVFGTGHSIYPAKGYNRPYIGTVQLDGGAYVWHVFENIKLQ